MSEQVLSSHALREDYWETFQVDSADLEFLHNHLLEIETPQTPEELLSALIRERIQRERKAIEEQRSAGGEIYLPSGTYEEGRSLVFPALDWESAEVVGVRKGINPQVGDFQVIRVDFGGGETREFAAGLDDHPLNRPPDAEEEDSPFSSSAILEEHGDHLSAALLEELQTNPDFVYIAGKWFPRALLLDVNVGHLNLAEAVLDMAGGGPLDTQYLLEQIELPKSDNPNLVEFSLDLALQADARFDEVGPAGKVLWFLKKLEPAEVLETPVFLRQQRVDYDPSVLTEEMIKLESDLGDELSPQAGEKTRQKEVSVSLIFPHWYTGTLPVSSKMGGIFPTAYDAPRIRLKFVDKDNDMEFPGWVVRDSRYVFGLKDWYVERGLMPGSIVRIKQGPNPGVLEVSTEGHRSAREYVRTALVGTDGGVVFAHLKQTITATIDDRMVVYITDPQALEVAWKQMKSNRIPFEKTVVDMFRELAKLNAQSHVHAIELYSAVNLVRRVPPSPIFALLASRPWFDHLGDFYFRLSDFEAQDD
ncbi:MAG: hypothetical protein R3335_02950 [Anaerolineales bacterium]|nr:hypothetical protein [Anaerolineales bacterium]